MSSIFVLNYNLFMLSILSLLTCEMIQQKYLRVINDWRTNKEMQHNNFINHEFFSIRIMKLEKKRKT